MERREIDIMVLRCVGVVSSEVVRLLCRVGFLLSLTQLTSQAKTSALYLLFTIHRCAC